MRTSPRAVRRTEGSDPQIAVTIGGLRVSVPTERTRAWKRDLLCHPWEGRPAEYQGEAKAILEEQIGAGHEVPWIYAVPVCQTPMCLQEHHLRWFRAQRIAYPDYVCVYCGLPGYTKDHLLPVTFTGKALRKYVAVVPACQECNSAIGGACGQRIGERREEAKRHIRHKYRKLLEVGRRWSAADLAECGPNLRRHIEASADKREVIQQRLDWPHDPDYDRRAFEKSGIEDPYAMDLL
jgi:5-methylcytosine-specific restriction endonuclease McrA